MQQEDKIEECTRHLKIISQALQAYQRDHQELPPHLSDLYPHYLSRKQVFHCPADSAPPRTKSKAEGEAYPPTSYRYEMSVDPVPPPLPGAGLLLGPQQPGENPTWRDIKTLQQITYGERVPVVRCWHHNGTVLTLTSTGQVYRSRPVWEYDPATIEVVLERMCQDLSAGAEAFLHNWLPSAVVNYAAAWLENGLPAALRRHLHLAANRLMAGADSLSDSAQPEIYSLAAHFYRAAGQREQALAACRSALARPGEHPDAAFLLADLKRATGQKQGAPPVRAYLKAAMTRGAVPGLSVAVIRSGNLVLAQGLGQANVELAVPASSQTVYQLASVTKQFTATSIMMLVEEGKIDLDERITHYLSDLPAAWSGVSVRHLLNHTSGIKSYTSIPDLWKLARNDYTMEEIIKLVAGDPLEFSPGEKFAYNNTGYFLLGMIIEKISGQSYEEFLAERIFTPLGMSATRVNDLKAIIPNRACGYTRQGSELRVGEYCSPTWPYAAGALVSTVRDLAKWDAALYTERLLKRSSLEQMWTPTQLTDGKPSDYGFGWGMGTYRGHRWVGHGGGIPGFATFIIRFVEAKVTVVLLANMDHMDSYGLAVGVARLYLPRPKALKSGDPATIRQHKDVLQHLMQGKVDAALFIEESSASLSAQIEQVGAFYRSLGPLTSFRLIEHKDQNEVQTYRYWSEIGSTTWIHTFDTVAKGKIISLQVEPG